MKAKETRSALISLQSSWVVCVMHLGLSLVLLASHVCTCSGAKVSATRLHNNLPVISHDLLNNSNFPFAYNPAFLEPTALTNFESCLLVRCQPSRLAPSLVAVSCNGTGDPTDVTSFAPITASSVVLAPSSDQDRQGIEDPRVAYVPDLRAYFMFYSAVFIALDKKWIVHLSVASCGAGCDPRKPSWTRHGALFPKENWTKSGALIVGEKPGDRTYLIFGDCSNGITGLQVSIAPPDLMPPWKILDNFLLFKTRPGKFDSYLVESGPPPVRLSDGNYFFIYNGAQRIDGPPNGLLYSPGWVILNGSNPLQVLERADEPFMMPEMAWETIGQVPFVVFVEAMRRDPSGAPDSFIVYYGAADTSVGAARVVVKINQRTYDVATDLDIGSTALGFN